MCVFDRFETVFDDGNPPSLADEWLTQEEILTNRAQNHLKTLRQGRKLWQDVSTKDSQDDRNYTPPKPSPRETPSVSPREHPKHMPPTFAPNPLQDPTTVLVKEPPLPSSPSEGDSQQVPATAPTPTAPSPAQVRRNPSRAARHRDNPQLRPSLTGQSYQHNKAATRRPRMSVLFPMSMIAAVMSSQSPISSHSAHMMHSQSLGFNPVTVTQEDSHPGLLQSPFALKAKANKDPDLPSLKESLTGPHSEDFWKAMNAEIVSLESKGAWTVVE